MHIRAETSCVDRLLWVALAAGTIGFMAGGCASRQMRPDDLSAQEHRRVAERESALAEVERAKFDPSARASSPIQVHNLPMIGEYNPTERHLRHAAEHARHAREHETAAAALERFEDSACGPLPANERGACPVMGPLAAVHDVPDGVQLRPVDDARLAEVLAHMRCHLAYARTRGFATAPDCPLYMKGVEIQLGADGRSIELTAKEPQVIEELRRRVHADAMQSAATIL
jgi:hypothetical protein